MDPWWVPRIHRLSKLATSSITEPGRAWFLISRTPPDGSANSYEPTPFETCFSSCGERVRLGAQFGHRFRKWPGRSGDAESRSPPAWPRGLNRQPKGVTNAMKAGLIVKTMIISQTGVTPLLSTAAEVCATRLRRISTLARTPPPGHLALLTRDAARYRSYFPIIEILAPTKRQM